MDLECEPFRAGDWLVQPTLNRLERNGKNTPIEPRTMGVLVYLAQHSGKVVSADELVENVWGGKYVGENPVYRSVSLLRRALEDDSHEPRYIQTLPKKGYRLLCQIHAVKPDTDPVASPDPDDTSVTRPGEGSIVAELARRGIFRVIMAYAIAAWLVLQVAEVTFEPFGIPLWVMRLLIVLVIVGFPIAVFLGWTLELTPQGVVRDVPYGDNKARHKKLVSDFVLVGLLLSVLGFIVLTQYLMDGETQPTQVEAVEQPVPTSPAAPLFSIAVLPFDNLSEYPENAFFADGLADEILTLLTQVDWLDVAARTSSFYFKDKDVDLETIAKRIRVRYVLEGSVRRDGQDIRVTAQLIDAATGYHRWASAYDSELADLFAIQSEIATAVVNSLELLLAEVGQVGSATQSGSVASVGTVTINYHPTESMDAYVYYLQGRDYLIRPREARNLDSAKRLFQRAVAIDPMYARAHAGLCGTYLEKYLQTSTTAFFRKAEQACQKALELDKTLSEVHIALGALYRESGKYDKSQAELERVLSVAPRSVDALLELAYTYNAKNDLVAAEAALRKAVALKPGYWAAHSQLANFLYIHRRYDEAVTYWQHVTQLTPDNSRGFSNLGAAYAMLDNFEASATAWERSLELSPSRLAYTNLGLSYYYLGRFEDSAEMQENALEYAPDDHRVWGRLAESYRFIPDQNERSRRAYEKAISLALEKIKINAKDWETAAYLGLYYAYLQSERQSREMLTQAHTLAPDNDTVYYLEALASHALADLDGTFKALEKSLELGYSRRLISSDPDLKPLLETPRMKELLLQRDDAVSAPGV